MMLHDLVLNFWRLMRQQLHAADVRCICKLVTVVANLGYSDIITVHHMTAYTGLYDMHTCSADG